LILFTSLARENVQGFCGRVAVCVGLRIGGGWVSADQGVEMGWDGMGEEGRERRRRNEGEEMELRRRGM